MTTQTPNVVFNSDHARLPPHTSAFCGASETVRRSCSRALPKHLVLVTTTTSGDAPAVRDVIVSPLFRHGQVLSRKGAGGGLCGNQNQASPCQTTMDLDCHVVSDRESDSCKPRNSPDNFNSKAVLVDLDTLRDESRVELKFPWSPVHRVEAPLHTTLFLGSSENLQVSAAKLTPNELEEEHLLREVAFNAAFKLETHRCTPTARCISCLTFCHTRLPSLQEEGCGTVKSLQLHEECPPVLRNVVDYEAGQAPKMARPGPKSKSSGYRGVTFYRRTGRWKAHIWHDGAQVYLGASGTKEEAARAHDQAALVLYGSDVDINLKPESYQVEMAYEALKARISGYESQVPDVLQSGASTQEADLVLIFVKCDICQLYKLSKEQLVIYLRRDSRGIGAQASYPGVKQVKNFYQATYSTILLGTFANEEDAARAVYKEAMRNSHGALASLILDTHHVRNMPSYAAQRFAALYPEEAVEGMQLRPSVPRRPWNSTSPQMKKCFTRKSTKPIQDFTSPPAAASPIAAPLHPREVEQLPGHKINGNIEVSPGAFIPTGNWGAYLEQHQPSNGTNTAALQQLRNFLPKFFRAPAPTTASSSCNAPRLPSLLCTTGEASSSGVIKFKLFNEDISVVVEPGYGGDRTEAHSESEPQLRNHLILQPSKRCKITGAAAPATETCSLENCARNAEGN